MRWACLASVELSIRLEPGMATVWRCLAGAWLLLVMHLQNQLLGLVSGAQRSVLPKPEIFLPQTKPSPTGFRKRNALLPRVSITQAQTWGLSLHHCRFHISLNPWAGSGPLF